MTDGLHIEDLTVRYPARREATLSEVSLDVEARRLIGITGRTGAGKSTLALAAAGFIPRVVRAAASGRVLVSGRDALTAVPGDLLGAVGIVFATPSDQLSGSKPTVREELAFGLENLGVPRSEMDQRLDDVMARLGIVHLAAREPASLSGGEQQRVAIASIVAMGPRTLVLDEPTAELDPAGAAAVATMLGELAASGTAILCVEQDRTILARCDRVLTLEAGRITDEPPRPGDVAPLHWTIGPGRPGVSARFDGVAYRYPNGIDALRDVSLAVPPGERVAIVGANGSGKTTLAKHLIGILRPTAGRVLLDDVPIDEAPVQSLAGTVGFAFQDPGDQLFERSVEREVSFGPRQLGRSDGEVAGLIEASLAMTGLADVRATNPYDLDRSLRKLVGLASVLAMDPALLVLDEPTTGQDPDGTQRVGRIVEAMAAAGRTVIAITHDRAFAERWFDRIVVMDAGRVVEDRPRPAA